MPVFSIYLPGKLLRNSKNNKVDNNTIRKNRNFNKNTSFYCLQVVSSDAEKKGLAGSLVLKEADRPK